MTCCRVEDTVGQAIKFNTARYTTLNTSDFIYNIPSGAVRLSEDELVFQYNWLCCLSHTVAIDMDDILSCEVIAANENNDHPFFKPNNLTITCIPYLNLDCIDIRYTQGDELKRMGIKTRSTEPIVSAIKAHLAKRSRYNTRYG